MRLADPLRPLLSAFAGDRRGNTAIAFVLASGGLLAAAGVAVDYGMLSATRDRYQAAADVAALAAAKEFRLGNANDVTLTSVASTHAAGTLGAEAAEAVITPSIDLEEKTVTVAIAAELPTHFLHLFGTAFTTVGATATARVVGGAPICVIGLDESANFTVSLDMSARLQAPGCAVYSNARTPNGLMAKNNAVLSAAFICTAGGKESPGPGSFDPTPQTDCPVIPDPLSARPEPAVTGCDHTGMSITGGSVALAPGSYCGGIRVSGGATVTLQPGVYTLTDGPLSVSEGAALTGQNVGIFLTGAGAVLDLAAASTVALTAPASGPLAGMLVFEGRASPEGQVHQVHSDDARTLLGTIYLPRNRLHVAATKPVADQSAYTIVVARLFTLSEGPTMVLNSNYGGTNIPVPDGVGPKANKALLVR